MADRTISVQIVGDSQDLERAFARSSKAAQKFNKDASQGSFRAELGLTNLRRQATGMAASYVGIAAAATAAGEAFSFSVSAASDLNEQVSKSRAVFGGSAGEVEDWSEQLAQSFGISQREALTAVGTFGNLFRTVGIGTKANAEMSRSLVELAADLASFNNTSPGEALDAIRSGLIGEAEPLRRYGVLLSETRVQQLAMAETGKRNARSLTDQEKALARYRIILSDTVTAQGDFQRTSGGLAGQTKILQAEMDNLAATVGNLVIPALTGMIGFLNDTISATRTLSDEVSELSAKLPLPDAISKENAASLVKYGLYWVPVIGEIYAGGQAIQWAASQFESAKAIMEQPIVLNVDYSALGLLTGAGQGLAAKDRIEGRGLGTPPAPFTTEQRRKFFDASLARQRDAVQDIASLSGKISKLEQIRAKIQAKLETTKDPTRRLKLEGEILDVNREIRSVRDQMHAESAAAARDAEAHAKEMQRLREEAARDLAERQETAAFRLLGLGPGGAPLAPGLDALRNRFERTLGDIGTRKLPESMRKLVEGIRKALVPGVKGVTEEVRQAIEDALVKIDDFLDKRTRRRRPRYRAVSTEQLLQGLGLSPEEIRLLTARLSGVDRFGRVPTPGVAAFGQTLGGSTVNLYGDMNITTDNPDAIVRYLQNRRRRTASQTRGTRAGSATSID